MVIRSASYCSFCSGVLFEKFKPGWESLLGSLPLQQPRLCARLKHQTPPFTLGPRIPLRLRKNGEIGPVRLANATLHPGLFSALLTGPSEFPDRAGMESHCRQTLAVMDLPRFPEETWGKEDSLS